MQAPTAERPPDLIGVLVDLRDEMLLVYYERYGLALSPKGGLPMPVRPVRN